MVSAELHGPQVIAMRREHAPIVTGGSEWDHIFDETTCAAAISDRLTHHALHCQALAKAWLTCRHHGGQAREHLRSPLDNGNGAC